MEASQVLLSDISPQLFNPHPNVIARYDKQCPQALAPKAAPNCSRRPTAINGRPIKRRICSSWNIECPRFLYRVLRRETGTQKAAHSIAAFSVTRLLGHGMRQSPPGCSTPCEHHNDLQCVRAGRRSKRDAPVNLHATTVLEGRTAAVEKWLEAQREAATAALANGGGSSMECTLLSTE